ncbi:hypothetical protein ACSSZE_13235 [Acidithiobacillus caldus]
MTKHAVFTMKLDPELRAEFMAAAAASHRPASQVLRELMREYIAQQKAEQGYQEYLQQKVAAARQSVARGLGRPNAEVEQEFALRRERVGSDA